jgi:hypothetical protein
VAIRVDQYPHLVRRGATHSFATVLGMSLPGTFPEAPGEASCLASAGCKPVP